MNGKEIISGSFRMGFFDLDADLDVEFKDVRVFGMGPFGFKVDLPTAWVANALIEIGKKASEPVLSMGGSVLNILSSKAEK